ncbi:suppressor of fused domain protein [Fusobacterium varium]|uniref:suppressor of fused domain protein n=1 Tax=Fusobacterium varium TaxID=856 RepID=UPI00356B45F8
MLTVVPIYEEEMQYKLKYETEGLLELFEEKEISYPPVVDKKRKNVCTQDSA